MAAILIVEDDKLLGRVLRDLLSDAGYKAFWADSIDSAKITLDAKEIHMVYLDLNLNNENGMHLLHYIKETEKLKSIMVIIISNEGQIEKLDTARELGAEDFMVKAAIDYENFVNFTKSKLPVY